MSGTPPGTDVVIIGGGLVGLATATACAARGADLTVLSAHRPGEASTAAAGMLAPGMESGDPGPAHDFAIRARDLYPSYLDALAEMTGQRVPLIRTGVIELIADRDEADRRHESMPPGALWLTSVQLHALEPDLSPPGGALFYPDDGAVDNVALMHALDAMVSANPAVRVLSETATGIALDGARPAVRLASGATLECDTLVIAAGAWTPALEGLPRPIPIEPLRGQMIEYADASLHHVVYGGHGYVVPRGSHTVAGSTMEHVGFATGTTPEALDDIASRALSLCPILAGARRQRTWFGFRPVTPDLLPILGRDPEVPALVYACGHSRNGILLGPLSGECVAALAAGEEPLADLSPFSITRFNGTS